MNRKSDALKELGYERMEDKYDIIYWNHSNNSGRRDYVKEVIISKENHDVYLKNKGYIADAPNGLDKAFSIEEILAISDVVKKYTKRKSYKDFKAMGFG